jgi:uncharacterized protein (DUF433 family)
MPEQISYVQMDEHGVMRVANKHVMLDSVVAAFVQGHSAETIRSQFPALTLEEVYGAITYYLSHQQEIEDYLRRQDAQWARWRDATRHVQGKAIDRLRLLQDTPAGPT